MAEGRAEWRGSQEQILLHPDGSLSCHIRHTDEYLKVDRKEICNFPRTLNINYDSVSHWPLNVFHWLPFMWREQLISGKPRTQFIFHCRFCPTGTKEIPSQTLLLQSQIVYIQRKIFKINTYHKMLKKITLMSCTDVIDWQHCMQGHILHNVTFTVIFWEIDGRHILYRRSNGQCYNSDVVVTGQL
jgi:hypothetical protein